MSNALAVAHVTQALALLIESNLRPEIDMAVSVETRKPPAEPPTEPTITVFLYQVTHNPSMRNHDLPTRASDGTLLNKPVAALDLHYVISAYGEESELVGQRLIGCVARIMREFPVLPADVIEVAGERPYLAGSDLAEAAQKVRFTPLQMDIDETSKLWGMLHQTPYSLSMTYQASLVLVEGREEPEPGHPVRRTEVTVGASGTGAAGGDSAGDTGGGPGPGPGPGSRPGSGSASSAARGRGVGGAVAGAGAAVAASGPGVSVGPDGGTEPGGRRAAVAREAGANAEAGAGAGTAEAARTDAAEPRAANAAGRSAAKTASSAAKSSTGKSSTATKNARTGAAQRGAAKGAAQQGARKSAARKSAAQKSAAQKSAAKSAAKKSAGKATSPNPAAENAAAKKTAAAKKAAAERPSRAGRTGSSGPDDTSDGKES